MLQEALGDSMNLAPAETFRLFEAGCFAYDANGFRHAVLRTPIDIRLYFATGERGKLLQLPVVVMAPPCYGGEARQDDNCGNRIEAPGNDAPALFKWTTSSHPGVAARTDARSIAALIGRRETAARTARGGPRHATPHSTLRRPRRRLRAR